MKSDSWRPVRDRASLACIALAAFSMSDPVRGGTTVEIHRGGDEQTRLPYWELRNPMMSLRLVQRLPMQTRAFFLARGFDREQVERIAQSCVFQTVFKNMSHTSDDPAELEYSLRDWQVSHGGRSHGLKVREDWAREWQQEDVPRPVQLAFEWALYPTRQAYQPGDYNWGMSLFNLSPGSRFDLTVTWQQGGESHRATIRDMRCATDDDVAEEDTND